MAWSFDMSSAPKGRMEIRKTIVKGVEKDRQVFVTERIIAASADGVTVTLSSWIPDQQRWNMFTKETPPIAWQPWPEHPGAQP